MAQVESYKPRNITAFKQVGRLILLFNKYALKDPVLYERRTLSQDPLDTERYSTYNTDQINLERGGKG